MVSTSTALDRFTLTLSGESSISSYQVRTVSKTVGDLYVTAYG